VRDARYGWLTRAWWLAPVCLVGVFVLEALLSHPVSFVALAVGDELAHLLTSAVAVLALLAVRKGRLGTPFVAGVVVAGNLIDADHVPLVLGSHILTQGTPRPYSHSLTFVAVLFVVAAVSRGRGRSLLLGAACGVGVHLVRDLATAPVGLFWPLLFQGVTIPYAVYAVVLTAGASIAAVALRAERRRASSQAPV
jgi:inner membrane protein